MSDSWIVILIVVTVFLFIVGNFSTVHKTAKKPMRKKSLNDLEETLPRTNKGNDQLPSFSKQSNYTNTKEHNEKSSD